MNGSGITERDLMQLRPRDVAQYLHNRGWAASGRVRYSERWTLRFGDREHRVLLPLDQELADYSDRMADLVHVLSEVEGRGAGAVHQDLTLAGLDVQYIKTQPRTPSGTIPVSDGVLAVTSARDLLMAAACDTVLEERRMVQPRRKPQRAKEFVDSARFGPSTPGSYILSIQVPLPAATSTGSLFEDAPELDVAPQPFARQVSRRMYEAVTAAGAAAAAADQEDDSSPFLNSVAQGVSADLCEALAGLGGHDGRSDRDGHGFSVSFAWSPRWPVPYSTALAEFPQRLVPVLREGSQDLRRHEPELGVTVVGRTKTLKRTADFGPGEITLEARTMKESGDLVGQLRQIHIHLGEEEYDRATEAHRERRDLKVEGDLVRRGTYLSLERVTAFHVL